MNKDLPIGTKVFLSPDSRWVNGSSSNPVGVEGVIIGIMNLSMVGLS